MDYQSRVVPGQAATIELSRKAESSVASSWTLSKARKSYRTWKLLRDVAVNFVGVLVALFVATIFFTLYRDHQKVNALWEMAVAKQGQPQLPPLHTTH